MTESPLPSSLTHDILDDFLAAFVAESRFAKKRMERKLLEALFQRWKGGGETAVQAHSLVTVIYGPEKRSGQQNANNIHNLRHQTNMLLREFAKFGPTHFEFLLQISPSPYQLTSGPKPNGMDGEKVSIDAFETFWAPYIHGDTAPCILFTSPLFYRDAKDRYVRDIQINNESQKAQLTDWLGAESVEGLVPSRHYYSAGEVNAVLKLLRRFRESDLHLEPHVVSSDDPLIERDQTNLIALGSGRTNWYMEAQQADRRFVVNRSNVTRRAEDSEKPFEDHVDRHGRLVKYAVLTRCPGQHSGLVTTMIGANHGRAAEGVAEYVTHEKDLKDLISRISDDDVLPPVFQVLFEVVVARVQMESIVFDTKVIDTWPRSEKKNATGT